MSISLVLLILTVLTSFSVALVMVRKTNKKYAWLDRIESEKLTDLRKRR